DGTATQFPETAARIRQMILRAPPASVAAAQRGMAARPDMSDILPQLDLPALVLVGSDDAISPPSEMRGIADVLPQAEFIEIAGAGHMCPMEKPDEVSAALREFLRRPV
ncbi:MAG: alpha/beta hydrolase, partial [Pirellulales bacterium]